MRSLAVGRVEASIVEGFAPGDYVKGMCGRQDHALATPAQGDRKIDDGYLPRPISLGALANLYRGDNLGKRLIHIGD